MTDQPALRAGDKVIRWHDYGWIKQLLFNRDSVCQYGEVLWRRWPFMKIKWRQWKQIGSGLIYWTEWHFAWTKFETTTAPAPKDE